MCRYRDKETNEVMAMKRIKFDHNFKLEGFPMTSVREINILLTMDHPNIVNVSEVVTSKPTGKTGPMDVYMVMEYVQLDLKKFLDTYKAKLKIGEVCRFQSSSAPLGVKVATSTPSFHPVSFLLFGMRCYICWD